MTEVSQVNNMSQWYKIPLGNLNNHPQSPIDNYTIVQIRRGEALITNNRGASNYVNVALPATNL